MSDETDSWLQDPIIGVSPQSFNQDNGGIVLTGADDPIVGQNKAVDPKDKGASIKGTWDFDKRPTIKGGTVDLPKMGSVDPNGDPLDTTADTPGNGDSPTPTKYNHLPPTTCPPGSVPEPSGIGGCRKVTPAPPSQSGDDDPDIPLPPPPPAPQPGDYNVPDGDTATA